MDNLKAKESCTLRPEITTQASLDLTKKKVEESTIGLEKKVTFMKASSRLESVMAEVLFGGLTEAGTKENSEMVCKADGEYFIGKEDIANLKVIGTMACLMVKARNTFRMVNVMKVLSNKTSSTEKACFTKMTQLFTEFGKTMSYQS